MKTYPLTSCFVSTALPYVNAAPHLGFALELSIADVIARAQRLKGRDVCFVSGTDEHSLKNVLAAERRGIPTPELVAENAQHFEALLGALNVSVDTFVRTSVHALHRSHVEGVWQTLERGGDLFRKQYRGLYCTGCERFYEPNELDAGRCPEHAEALDECTEENWFFRLSRYRDRVRELIESGRVRVEPECAKREILRFLEGEVFDLSVSRDASRARGFGIPVPSDPSQVVYVWVDALFGYLTALGQDRERYWSGAAERIHVIGKGITRFHAVYWLALLLASGEEPPTRILVHGYLTIDGEKISKSGSSVDPRPLLAEYGSDAVRYYLLRHVKTTRDGDFSLERFVTCHDAELSNQLGNLLSRTLTLIERDHHRRIPEPCELNAGDQTLIELAQQLEPAVLEAIEAFQLDRGLDLVFGLVEAANRYVDDQQPWVLVQQGKDARFASVLHSLCRVLFVLGRALSPYLPRASSVILSALGASLESVDLESGALITRPSPLFPRRRLRALK